MASKQARKRQTKRERRKAAEKLASGKTPAAKQKLGIVGHGASGNRRLRLDVARRCKSSPVKAGRRESPRGEEIVVKVPLGKGKRGKALRHKTVKLKKRLEAGDLVSRGPAPHREACHVHASSGAATQGEEFHE